jgi:hypothetical protein
MKLQKINTPVSEAMLPLLYSGNYNAGFGSTIGTSTIGIKLPSIAQKCKLTALNISVEILKPDTFYINPLSIANCKFWIELLNGNTFYSAIADGSNYSGTNVTPTKLNLDYGLNDLSKVPEIDLGQIAGNDLQILSKIFLPSAFAGVTFVIDWTLTLLYK